MEKIKSDIESYIEKLITITSGKQRRYYQWLKDEGESYSRDADRLKLGSKEVNFLGLRIKECYRNSSLLTISHGMNYVEGYFSVLGGVYLDHAFNTKDGKLVDSTSELIDTEVEEWYGVTIPEYYVRKIIFRNKDFYRTIAHSYFMDVIDKN